MIQIDKSKSLPSLAWLDESKALTKKMCDDYDNDPNDFKIKGNEKKPIKPIFTDHYTKVKNLLIEIQSDKCCYCERKVTSDEQDGDVEHFRPKKAYKNSSGDILTYPGYYWLAYDWNNLFLSCQQCNRRFKKNLFPLEENSFRMNSHNDNARTKDEKFLLIHPENDIPERYLTFDAEIVKGLADKGWKTIEVCNLNRTSLTNSRQELLLDIDNKLSVLEILKKNTNIDQSMQKVIMYIESKLNDCAKSKSKFAGMVRANFPNLPKD